MEEYIGRCLLCKNKYDPIELVFLREEDRGVRGVCKICYMELMENFLMEQKNLLEKFFEYAERVVKAGEKNESKTSR